MRNLTVRTRRSVLGIFFALAVGSHSPAQDMEETAGNKGYIQHQILELEGEESLHEVRFLDQLGSVRELRYSNRLPDEKEIIAWLQIDVDFPGGTAADLVEVIAEGYREAYRRLPDTLRQSVQVFQVKTHIPNYARDINLPALKLRGVYQNLNSVNHWLPRGIRVKLERPKRDRDEEQVPAQVSITGGREWAVFNLRGVLAFYTVEDILSLLETAWQMQSDTIATEVKVHDPTSTLHILGSSGEIATASQIFAALPQVPSWQKRRPE